MRICIDCILDAYAVWRTFEKTGRQDFPEPGKPAAGRTRFASLPFRAGRPGPYGGTYAGPDFGPPHGGRTGARRTEYDGNLFGDAQPVVCRRSFQVGIALLPIFSLFDCAGEWLEGEGPQYGWLWAAADLSAIVYAVPKYLKCRTARFDGSSVQARVPADSVREKQTVL